MVEPFLVSTLPDLAVRLRDARERLGVSQAWVARRLYLHHTAVSNWEICRVRPGAGLLIAWARAVGMPLWAIPAAGDEPASVTELQLDLTAAVLRIEQFAAVPAGDPLREHLIQRLITCDGPRLRGHLSEAALAETASAGRPQERA